MCVGWGGAGGRAMVCTCTNHMALKPTGTCTNHMALRPTGEQGACVGQAGRQSVRRARVRALRCSISWFSLLAGSSAASGPGVLPLLLGHGPGALLGPGPTPCRF